MKTFFTKHKILLIAFSAVLCLGILSGLVVGGVIRLSTGGGSFTTVADAKEPLQIAAAPGKTQDEAQKEPDASGSQDKSASEPTKDTVESEPVMPKPTAVPTDKKLSAAEIKQIGESVRNRRRSVIPVRTESEVPENKYRWDVGTPSKERAEAARKAADELTQTIFGMSFEKLTGVQVSEASVVLLTDKEGDRDAFFRIQDPDGVYLISLRDSDFGLICADLLTYPDGAASDREKENIMLAEKLGYAAKAWHNDNGGRSGETVYYYKTETDTCLTFSYIGNKLWQVAVYPSSDTAIESEYFLADLQCDYKNKAYPENFVAAERPDLGYDKMTNDGKIFAALSRLYRNLSGNELDVSKLEATFYRDESGAREDCWRITGEGFDITVSAYSRNVIRFTSEIPCKNLLTIPYKDMGGEEYEDAAKTIAQYFITSIGRYDGNARGKDVKEVYTNAVYDSHYCTVDIELMDGTVYECYFKDGVLKEMWYWANSSLQYAGPYGWVADNVYVNSATHKPFIPDYRDWDGDLHVAERPEN